MKGVARLRSASVSRLAGIAGDSRMGQPAPVLSRFILTHVRRVSRRTETSKYLEENKSTEIP